MRSVRRTKRGLTLLEVVISLALITMLVGALLTFFWQTLEIRDQAMRAADRTNLAQQVLDRMAGELESCSALPDVGFPIEQFVGDRRSVTFITCPLPPDESYDFYRDAAYAPSPQHDLREITYSLWVEQDEETEEGDPLVGGILRTERRALDPYMPEAEAPEDEELIYVRRDLWAPELGYLEFRYYDGVQWAPRWQVSEGNKLPHQIQITIGFDSLTQEEYDDQDLDQYPIDQYPLGPNEPDINHFSRIVRIPAADMMFSARLYRLGSDVEELYQFMGAGDAGAGEFDPNEGEQ